MAAPKRTAAERAALAWLRRGTPQERRERMALLELMRRAYVTGIPHYRLSPGMAERYHPATARAAARHARTIELAARRLERGQEVRPAVASIAGRPVIDVRPEDRGPSRGWQPITTSVQVIDPTTGQPLVVLVTAYARAGASRQGVLTTVAWALAQESGDPGSERIRAYYQALLAGRYAMLHG